MNSAPTLTPERNNDPGYKWYLENLAEIRQIIETDIRLETLRRIESDLDLPAGTAIQFQQLYAEATTVSPHEEERYATTWDHYHAALDGDSNLSALAHAYRARTPLPLYQCIDDTGTFIF